MSPTQIPILDLKAQYSSIKAEIQSAIQRVLDSQQFILGAEVEALESELAEYCQCKHAFGVSSGTDALLLALMAIGIQPGDEVITTPYSFFSSSGSIVRLGAKPIYVDVEPRSLNLQVDQVETKITSRTRAILPVHLAGQVADMGPLMAIANRHGLNVVEDACQAIGADYQAKRAGSIGQLGCFSFFPSKNLGGYGDSGLVTCSDDALADKVSLLRNHGMRPKYHNQLVGGNFRMDALQAAVLRVKFQYLEGWTETRRKHAAEYRRLFTDRGISIDMDQLGHRAGIVLPSESGRGRHIYHLYLIRCKQRDQLKKYLSKHEIGSEIYYPVPLHLQECFAQLAHKAGDFPHSERAANETLALPIYPEMTIDMLTQVVDTVADFLRSSPA